MDLLAGYSSDDSSLDSDHVREDSLKNVKTDLAHQPIIQQTGVQSPHATTGFEEDSVESEDLDNSNLEAASSTKLPFPLVSYLQEYSMHAKNRTSVFIYLPWNPTGEIKTQLRAVNDLALRKLRENIPNFSSRFTHNSNLDGRSVKHGSFGFMNKSSLTKIHVSLFPNTVLPLHKSRQFLANIQREVSRIPVPKEMKQKKEITALDLMLSDGKASHSENIRFKIDEHLRLYKLTRSGLIFVGVGLNKFLELDKTRTLPQFGYLTTISRAIENQANLIDSSFNWLQFNILQDNRQGNISRMYYHFTLVVCELKPLGRRVGDDEFEHAREVIGLLDASEYLRDMWLEADHLVVSTVQKKHKILLPV